jgi:hypothetical protein
MTSLLLTATTAVDGLEGSGLLVVAALVVLGWLLVLIALSRTLRTSPAEELGSTNPASTGATAEAARAAADDSGSAARYGTGPSAGNTAAAEDHRETTNTRTGVRRPALAPVA